MSEDTPASEASPPSPTKSKSGVHFFLRGLAITLPPILTLLILIWILNVLDTYILSPTSGAVRWSITQFTDESRPSSEFQAPAPWMPPLEYCDRKYVVPPKLDERLEKFRQAERARNQTPEQISVSVQKQLIDEAFIDYGEKAVAYSHYLEVAKVKRPEQMPKTARGIYMELVTIRYFKSQFVFSAVAVIVAVLLLYFIGRIVTVRLGAWVVQKFESGVMARVPLVSQVYSSVKQVTDFFFTERTVEYNRVVAVEYPRKGIWSIGFVTSDSLLGMVVAAGEPLVSVLMPTSPMPMTGFTVNIPRSEVVDLDVTIDQAFQYCLSCGVLVPENQKVTPEILNQALAGRIPKTVASDSAEAESDSQSNISSSDQTGTTETEAKK